MTPEPLDFMERACPTPRRGLPDDAAHRMGFPASDKPNAATGRTFVVDGGGTAHQPWGRVIRRRRSAE